MARKIDTEGGRFRIQPMLPLLTSIQTTVERAALTTHYGQPAVKVDCRIELGSAHLLLLTIDQAREADIIVEV